VRKGGWVGVVGRGDGWRVGGCGGPGRCIVGLCIVIAYCERVLLGCRFTGSV